MAPGSRHHNRRLLGVLSLLHQLRHIWIRVGSSLWFVPLGLVFGAITLAVVLIGVDVFVGTEWIGKKSLVFGVGASGARGVLAAIAGSMMTVASLTFSLTISTLAAASSQYTSRLIRNFMRDRVNQFVLGYFVGLFAYCLVVLRTIRSGEDEAAFVPSLAVTGGLLLALVSIAVLIYFIHHIAESIQVGVILRRVTGETLETIDELFPADVGEAATATAAASNSDPAPLGVTPHAIQDVYAGLHWYPVSAQRFGYVESLDAKSLLALAAKHDAVVRMSADIGSFVTSEGLLCEAATVSPPAEDFIVQVRGTFSIGAARTIEQDAAFGIRQIVDISLKALSPGVNDTTTAIMCLDYLTAILVRLAAREIPSSHRFKDGKLLVIARGPTFDSLLAEAFDQIRQNAEGNVAVLARLVEALETIAKATVHTRRRQGLRTQAELIAAVAERTVTPAEAAGINVALVRLNQILNLLGATETFVSRLGR